MVHFLKELVLEADPKSHVRIGHIRHSRRKGDRIKKAERPERAWHIRGTFTLVKQSTRWVAPTTSPKKKDMVYVTGTK